MYYVLFHSWPPNVTRTFVWIINVAGLLDVKGNGVYIGSRAIKLWN